MNRIIDKNGLLFCGMSALLAAAGCGSSSGSSDQGSGASSSSGAFGGSGGSGAVGGSGAIGGGSAGGSPATGGPCLTTAKEGFFIGDSYETGALSPNLQTTLSGAMYDPTVAQFDFYAVAGTSMATGGILPGSDIPNQYMQAITASKDRKFTIMDGGGNDILICDAGMFPGCAAACTTAGSSQNTMCQTIVQKAVDTAGTLMMNSASSGIKDVIYFFYPHIPDAGPGGAGFSEILDYAEPKAKALCDGANAMTGGKLTCHFIDLVQPFKAAGGDKNPANFVGDGIHPSQTGDNIIATEILNVMKQDCIGFTSSDAQKFGCTCTQ